MTLGETLKIFPKQKSIFVKEEDFSNRYHFDTENFLYTDKDVQVGAGTDANKITYRINLNPISVEIKTFDFYINDTIPSIKEGVAYPPKVLDPGYTEDLFDNFKKKHDWRPLNLANMSPVIFYILYLHPEIISKEKFISYLSDVKFHIETAKKSIGAHVKNISPKIYIKTGQVSTYLDTEGFDVGGHVPEEYWVKIRHIFITADPEFCGLDQETFRRSHLILKYIDMFLAL